MNLAPPLPETRLRRVIAGLRDLLARHLPQQADPLPAFLVWQWLHRLVRRLDSLGFSLSPDPAMPPGPSPAAPGRALPDCAASPAALPPRRRGWLLDIAPEFADHGEQLRRLLADPRIQALLEDSSRLAPTLRRLLHLLDIAGPVPLAAAPTIATPAISTPPPPPARVPSLPPPCWALPAPAAFKFPA